MWGPCNTQSLSRMAFLLLLVFSAPIASVSPGSGGLLVIVTFPSLVHDLELILAPDDEVLSLVPPGADPHDYQLTPYDMELLRRADLIVSTAHTSFEAEIRRLHDEGELEGALVEIPDVPGIKLLQNPATGQPNYHMPIYDPDNYISFVLYVRGLLVGLRPEKADYYRERSRAILAAINELVSNSPKLNARAAADMPVVQYAVCWLGVEITFLLVKEHGVPATPTDVLELEEAASEGLIELVVVSEPVEASASECLEEIAEENGIPVLYVPSPLSPASILEKLSLISQRAELLSLSGKPSSREGAWWRTGLILAAATALALLIALSAAVALYTRG